jgi:hypothetical protein
VCKTEKRTPLLPVPFAPHAILHIDEEIHPPIGVNIRKPPHLEGETCPLGIEHDKNHCLPEPQLSPQHHEKKQPMKPNQLKWG